MIAELEEYTDSNPVDAPTVRVILLFLRSMNKLFEEGLLSHERITNLDSPVLMRMEEGFSFLTTWLDSLLEQGI